MKYMQMTDEQLAQKPNNPIDADIRGLVQAYKGLDKLYSLMTVEQLRTAWLGATSEGDKNLIAYWGKKKAKEAGND